MREWWITLFAAAFAVAATGCFMPPSQDLHAYWEEGCNMGYASDCADLRGYFNEHQRARHGNPDVVLPQDLVYTNPNLKDCDLDCRASCESIFNTSQCMLECCYPELSGEERQAQK